MRKSAKPEVIEKLRLAVEKFAQNANITQEEFEASFQEAMKEMDERGIPEDEKEYYSLKRVQLSLKRRFSGSSQEAEGFFIGKQPAFDYVKKPREEAQDFIREQGQIAAKTAGLCNKDLVPIDFYIDVETNIPTTHFTMEDEEQGKVKRVEARTPEELSDYIYKAGSIEAQKRGMMDDKGNFLYLKPEFKKGKVMPEHDYGAVAYGIFKMPGDDEPKVATVTLRGENAIDTLPLYKIVKFPAKVNKDKTTSSHYELSMSKPISSVGEEQDYWDFDDLILESVPDRRLDDLQDLPKFIEGHDEFRSWCIVEADIINVGMIGDDYDSVAVTITDYTMTSINSDDNELTFWIDKRLVPGLADGISDVVFAINPYVKKDGEISGNILGYWVDPQLLPTVENELEAKDTLNPW